MSDEEDSKLLEFHEMGLDDRLLKAISMLGWSSPTPIQERAIPLALEGKDILSQARTGSGKTGAFAIPVIQKVLISKQTATEQCVKAVIMTPTKELCSQAYRNIQELTSCCSREVKCVDVSPQVPLPSQRPMLSEKPDIVVGTPSRLLAHIQAGNLDVSESLEMIVIDEADLVFSFGYEDNVKAILNHMPKIYQAFLMSATLGDDVKALKKMVLHNAVILKLNETNLPQTSQLTQYHIKCAEEDKFALVYALLKLRLVRGKTILFVNNVDRCYKLRLFLEQFGIPACVLNSELPVNSRCHIVSQFNNGLYDYIIASDENLLQDPRNKPQQDNTQKRGRKKDQEFGVSRGLDFQNVSNVINFDFPTTVQAYIHRVGRTARGENKGTALSFVSIKEMPLLENVEAELAGHEGHESAVFKPYQFKMEEIEGFKYRAKDAMAAVTRVAIREARLKEIKQEILNSQKLKSHFEDNPRDLQILRHDKNLHTVKSQPHMKHVPDYLIPATLQRLAGKGRGSKKSRRGNARKQGPTEGQMKFKKRKSDPLKSLKFEGLGMKKKRKTGRAKK
ncbi:probable ATP-dependent RNA helicase DDX56 [Mya arenaria]|uniref:probable ATP-dependent RNA helicase DDX56 n=1 Tax=Mya arenaria TaxID=6604 RepID=UPI0022E45750|nr:probable ATP-dependent RNA helicase DDX56 [Mya arenaria]XP_052772943.1 probable ATP-dependent RNA helicase DDX56 [Mya arenaria]